MQIHPIQILCYANFLKVWRSNYNSTFIQLPNTYFAEIDGFSFHFWGRKERGRRWEWGFIKSDLYLPEMFRLPYRSSTERSWSYWIYMCEQTAPNLPELPSTNLECKAHTHGNMAFETPASLLHFWVLQILWLLPIGSLMQFWKYYGNWEALYSHSTKTCNKLLIIVPCMVTHKITFISNFPKIALNSITWPCFVINPTSIDVGKEQYEH